MKDPTEQFIDAAVSPLGDNAELQVMARRELEGCMTPGNASDLAAAIAAIETPSPRRRWRIALYVATAAVSIVSLGLLGMMVQSIHGFRMMFDPISAMGSSPALSKTEAILGKGLRAEQRLLLFGDASKSNPADRYRALWNSDPQNPAYFAEYALHFIGKHDRLPPDFLETAAKLDPDNAWFTLIAAGVTAKNAMKRNSLSRPQVHQGVPPGYKILDQTRLNEAVKLLEKAAGQPRFESYQPELMASRIALLPKRTDFASQLPGLVHVGGYPSGAIHLMGAYSVADSAAWQAEDRGDATGFRQIAAWWEPTLRRWVAADCPDLIHGLVVRTTLAGTANRYAKTSLPGLDDLRVRWQPLASKMLAEKEERDRRKTDERPKLKGGMLAGLALPVSLGQVQNPPPITDADLMPGRMVDHELFARVSAAVAWVTLGLMLLAAALYRQRTSVLVRRLSGRLENLLRLSDWAWILGAGVVIPFLFYLALCRLTPLGARDWSVAASAFLVPSGQTAAMTWLMILLPVLIARWRLGRRGAVIGFQGSPSRWRWFAVACGALALPVFGLSFARGKGSEAVMMTAAGLLGVLVLEWLVTGIRAMFSKRPALLRRVTLSRLLVPAYALGMLLMALSMPLYHAAEKRWLAHDRLSEMTPEAPGLSRYEWELAQTMRQDLLKALEMK